MKAVCLTRSLLRVQICPSVRATACNQDELWTASHSITLNYNTLASVKDTHYGHVCARWGVHACTRPYRSCILMWDACFNCLCVCINVFSLATDAAFMCFFAHERFSVGESREGTNTSIYKPYVTLSGKTQLKSKKNHPSYSKEHSVKM